MLLLGVKQVGMPFAPEMPLRDDPNAPGAFHHHDVSRGASVNRAQRCAIRQNDLLGPFVIMSCLNGVSPSARMTGEDSSRWNTTARYAGTTRSSKTSSGAKSRQ